MFGSLKDRCSSWVKKNNDAIQGVGNIIEKGGRLVPIFGAPIVAFGAALQYVGEVYEKEQKKAEELQAEFDELSEHLKILAAHIPDLEKRVKEESQVVEQMRVLYVDIDKWAYLIQKAKKPPAVQDLIDSMKRKNLRLKQCIDAETWATVIAMAAKVDDIKVAVVRPAKEVYDEGKDLFAMEDYIKARQSFELYQRLIQTQPPRVPDNSQQYLADCWDKLNEKQQEEASRLHSRVPTVNPYRQKAAVTSPTKPTLPKQSSLPSTPATAAPTKAAPAGGVTPAGGPSRTGAKK